MSSIPCRSGEVEARQQSTSTSCPPANAPRDISRRHAQPTAPIPKEPNTASLALSQPRLYARHPPLLTFCWLVDCTFDILSLAAICAKLGRGGGCICGNCCAAGRPPRTAPLLARLLPAIAAVPPADTMLECLRPAPRFDASEFFEGLCCCGGFTRRDVVGGSVGMRLRGVAELMTGSCWGCCAKALPWLTAGCLTGDGTPLPP